MPEKVLTQPKYEYIYNLSGLLIVYMIYLHIRQSVGFGHVFYDTIDKIFFFFMPWFYFKSGMFYKDESINKTLKKATNKLLKPFIVYSFIGAFVFAFYLISLDDFNIFSYIKSMVVQLFIKGNVAGNAPLWFLLSLMFAKLIAKSIIDHRNNTIRTNDKRNFAFYDLFFITALFFIAIIHTTFLTPNYIHYVGNISCGTIFYLLGYKLSRLQYQKKYIYTSLLFLILFYIFIPTCVNFRMNKLLYGSYILWFPASIAAIIVWNNMFRLLPNIRILNWIGKRSMDFYVIHFFIIYGILAILQFLNVQRHVFIFLLLSCMIVIPLSVILHRKIKI